MSKYYINFNTNETNIPNNSEELDSINSSINRNTQAVKDLTKAQDRVSISLDEYNSLKNCQEFYENFKKIVSVNSEIGDSLLDYIQNCELIDIVEQTNIIDFDKFFGLHFKLNRENIFRMIKEKK